MVDVAKPHLSSFGFSPSISPKPAYPAFTTVACVQAKSMLFSTGFWGVLLCLWLEPTFAAIVFNLQKRGYSEALMFTIILNGMHSLQWVLTNVPLLYLDATSSLAEYKMHRADGQKPSGGLMKEGLLTAAIVQLVLNPVLGFYLHTHWASLGLKSMRSSLPPVKDIFISLLIAHVFNDVFFYVAHRLFHSKSLYFLHKQHHQFAGTVGFAAEFANPVEVAIANVFPTFYGCVFFGCKHPLVLLVWVSVRLHETYMAHSGYCFKDTWLDTIALAHPYEAIHHDHHHTANRGNFGCLFTDWLFGTMDFYAQAGCWDGYLAKARGKDESAVDANASAANASTVKTGAAKSVGSPKKRSRSKGRK